MSIPSLPPRDDDCCIDCDRGARRQRTTWQSAYPGQKRVIEDVNVGPPGGRHRNRGHVTEGADDADGDDEDFG
jgi:hypothetical protein